MSSLKGCTTITVGTKTMVRLGIKKKTHKVRDITYTPDFVDPSGKWIIECKGYANERFPLKWKMFLKLLNEKGDPPVLFVPRNQKQVLETVEMILELTAPTK